MSSSLTYPQLNSASPLTHKVKRLEQQYVTPRIKRSCEIKLRITTISQQQQWINKKQ
jgi:hypothetical protein